MNESRSNFSSVFLALVVSAGIATPQTNGDLILAGTVINSRTGETISRAMVQINLFAKRIDPDEPATPRVIKTLTDQAGTFRFSGLEPGKYYLTLQKPQFWPDYENNARSIQTDLSSSIENLQVKMLPLGVITGRVKDESGEPLRNVRIQAISTDVRDGLRHTTQSLDVATDDRGMYRLWNLTPGKYYVRAAGWSGGTRSYIGDNSPQLFSDDTFEPLFSGGERTLTSAMPVVIEAGTVAMADFSLKLVTALKIRGSLANVATVSPITFELIAGQGDASSVRSSLNRETGRFEIQDVAPGSYLIRVTQDKNRAETRVTVAADIAGVPLSLVPGVNLKATVHTIATTTTAEQPENFGLRQRSICNLRLVSMDNAAPFPYSFVPESADTLNATGVFPGRYRIVPNCYRAYVQSLVSGSQDLLADPILTVQSGAPPRPIEVVAIGGTASLRGTLQGTYGPDDRLQILLVPQSSRSSGPMIVTPFPSQADGGGMQFVTGSIAPGSYRIFAFLNRDDIEYYNQDFLKSLPEGVSVEISDSGEQNVTIQKVIR